MKLLGLDFETQCDNAKETRVTEVGAVLLELAADDDFGTIAAWHERARLSALCWTLEYPPQTPEIVELTGITDDDLRATGRDPYEVFKALLPLVEKADVVVAHNKKFDQTVFEATCQKLGINFPPREWLCTYTEVPYPKRYTCKKLAHLAYEHGLKMDDRKLHRALNDVQLMLELLTTKYDIKDVLAYAREPWAFLKADILPPWQDGGKGKEQASKLGYSWEKPRAGPEQVFPKTWVKACKASQVEKEKELAPFRVAVLG